MFQLCENRGVEQSVNVFSRDTCEKNRAAGLLQPMHVFLALALTTSPATHKHDVHAQQKATPNETTSRSYCVELQIKYFEHFRYIRCPWWINGIMRPPTRYCD